jgi:hypothetical protein
MTDQTPRTSYYVYTGKTPRSMDGKFDGVAYQRVTTDMSELDDREARVSTAWRVDGAQLSTEAAALVLTSLAGQWVGSDITITRIIPREPTADEKLDAARSVLRADYWQDVRNVVDDLRANIERGHVTDREDAERFLDESCDGHQRVIYTGQAIECLLFSRHEDAYTDAGGEAIDVSDGSAWSTLAYYAFRADVDDAVGDLDALFTVEPEDEAECYVCGEPFKDDDGPTEVTNFGSEGRHRSHVVCPDEESDDAE